MGGSWSLSGRRSRVLRRLRGVQGIVLGRLEGVLGVFWEVSEDLGRSLGCLRRFGGVLEALGGSRDRFLEAHGWNRGGKISEI